MFDLPCQKAGNQEAGNLRQKRNNIIGRNGRDAAQININRYVPPAGLNGVRLVDAFEEPDGFMLVRSDPVDFVNHIPNPEIQFGGDAVSFKAGNRPFLGGIFLKVNTGQRVTEHQDKGPNLIGHKK
ncbi:hypothetical protein D3C75_969780 [compost metagenome]